MTKQSLKYALYSTFYAWIAIFLFLYFIYGVKLPHTLSNVMYSIPLLSTFLAGLYLFNKIKEPWLLGIAHYLLAHAFVFFLFVILTFLEDLTEKGFSKHIIINSYQTGAKAVTFSLFGMQLVLPTFVLGGYFSKKKIK